MNLNNNFSEFKQFIIDNNIIGTLAGVCIALAAKDGIQSFVGDIVIPSIVFLLHALHIDILTKYLPVNGVAQFKVGDFLKHMITFVLIISMTFLFVKVTFNYLLNIDLKKKDNSQTEKFTNFGNFENV